MDVRFTVGEMAALNGISKQTLIFYDKQGVLKPKYQDNKNRYRYYTADQLEQLDSILILRELGLPLREIKRHMDNRTPESALALLKNQHIAVKNRIERLQTIDQRISHKVQSLETLRQNPRPFAIREMKRQLLAVFPVEEPRGLLEVDIALKKLFQQANAADAAHFYQIGDIVGQKDLLNRDFVRFQYAFLPVIKPSKHLEIMVKEAGTYAVAYHYGPYTSAGETYASMLAQIARQGREPCSGAYEFCLFDSLTSRSPKGYCTEIHIRLR